MIKRLLVLNGLAIIAVVLNHTFWYGQMALFLWVDRYRPVSVPNWDQLGSLTYYILLIIRQLGVFSVPAFLFTSGYFIAYASMGSRNKVSWKTIRTRIILLLIPYLIWSSLIFIKDFLEGSRYPPLEYLRIIFTEGAYGPYFFVPLLCYFYLLSPFIVSLLKQNCKVVLMVSAILQFSVTLVQYPKISHLEIPGWHALLLLTSSWLPFQWFFYFVLGSATALYVKPFTEWLAKAKKFILVCLPVFALLNIIEGDLQVRTKESWGAYQWTLSFHSYALVVLLLILSLDTIKFPGFLGKLGSKSYGIYLVHFPIIIISAKLVDNFAPWLLGNQLLLQPLLFGIAFGVPLVLMLFVSKTPMKRYYRYLFG